MESTLELLSNEVSKILTLHFIPPIVQHLKEKGVQITEAELFEVLKLPAGPLNPPALETKTGRKTIAKTVPDSHCEYKYKKGKRAENQETCDKPCIQGSKLCRTHHNQMIKSGGKANTNTGFVKTEEKKPGAKFNKDINSLVLVETGFVLKTDVSVDPKKPLRDEHGKTIIIGILDAENKQVRIPTEDELKNLDEKFVYKPEVDSTPNTKVEEKKEEEKKVPITRPKVGVSLSQKLQSAAQGKGV